jgi:ATP-dependent exoDNAse (exonuclease V) alpha subunit
LVADAETWLEDQKRTLPNAENELPFTDYRLLKGEQREIFLGVMAHVRQTVMPTDGTDPPPPLRINIDGTAGTGKSFLIGAICTSLKELADSLGIPQPVIRLAPTGVSAYGIRGYTINSGCAIAVKGWSPLSGGRLAQMQDRWLNYKIIILDEKSMVGRKMAGKLDRRTRQFKPGCHDEILAGHSLLLFGDFAQLPPVGDSPLFTTYDVKDPTNLAVEGRALYQSIQHSITLQHIFRQQGNDPAQVAFRDCLMEIRDMNLSDASYELLKPRFWDNLSQAERAAFANEIHLLPTREGVHTFNVHRLASLNTPVLICKAKNHGLDAAKASSDDAEGLENTIMLSEGANVMLTRNLWTNVGQCCSLLFSICRCLMYMFP